MRARSVYRSGRVLSQTDFVLALMQEERLLTPEALEKASRHATEHHTSIAEATVSLGYITARELSAGGPRALRD